MARFIDADLLLENINDSVVFTVRDKNSPELRGARKIINEIKNAPTVDVVEVVRCKDCKNYDKFGQRCGNHSFLDTDDPYAYLTLCGNDFCSEGERK